MKPRPHRQAKVKRLPSGQHHAEGLICTISFNHMTLGQGTVVIPTYPHATEEETAAWRGDDMSLVPALKRQIQDSVSQPLKLRPPSACSIKLLGPEPNSNMHACVYTRHKCVLRTREARAQLGTAGLSKSACPLPPSPAGPQATYGSI